MFKFGTGTILNNAAEAEVITYDSDNSVLKIKGVGKFNISDIKKIYKRETNIGRKSTATITLTPANDQVAGNYRLITHVKLVGSNNSNFANDMVFKGKDFTFDFEVADGGSIIKSLEKAINYVATRFGERVYTVTATYSKTSAQNSNNGAVNGSIVLTPAVNSSVTTDDVYYIDITQCELKSISYPTSDNKGVQELTSDVEGTISVLPCVNPFGTYSQLLKDFRLPTAENTGWVSLNTTMNEMPLINQTYNQYIIYMCKDRGIMGGSAVGQAVTSITAHTIWVPSTYVEAANDAPAYYSDPLATVLAGITLTGKFEEFTGANLSNTENTSTTAFADLDATEGDLQ